MGCDIHAHAEFKINGRWEHLSEVDIDRSYDLFSKMVDGHGRSCGQKGIAPERGLPHDVNPLTKYILMDIEFHTRSYLTGSELKALITDPDDRYPFLDAYNYNWIVGQKCIFSDDFRLVFAFDN